MKRYRVLGFSFDSRAQMLEPIQDHWEEKVKEGHRENQQRVEQELRLEFGELNFPQKRRDFVELGPAPFSILAFHNRFLEQIRTAFVVASYYPALTGACALGERILNHLILLLRDDFRATPEYKRVYNKDSFDDWGVAIDVLESWRVLLPKAATAFRSLEMRRHRALHFRPEVDTDDRALALESIKLLETAIQEQFSGLGSQPWFIPNTPGASYITREAESWPFVRLVYLPNSYQVGPRHRLEFENFRFVVSDENDYPDTEISDAEFCAQLQRVERDRLDA